MRTTAGRRNRGGLMVLCGLMLAGGLAGCHQHEQGKPALQGTAASSQGAAGTQPFGLTSAGSQSTSNGTALSLHFTTRLASAQPFDQQIVVTGPHGEAVNGSWALQDDGSTLLFPYVTPNQHYAVLLHAGLVAADGRTLDHELKQDIYSGNVTPALGFASTGSVLPARGSRGLPVVSVNVQDADIEFFRVHDEALSDLFCAYPNNKHRDTYELQHEPNTYDRCENGDRPKLALTDMGDSVYANHYTLEGKPNERTITYIPLQNVPQLAQPGVYMAVLKQGGTFNNGYDTAIFFVSDLGLHLRVYKGNALLHVASLHDGSPVSGVAVEVDDSSGHAKLKATTDGDGNALIAYQVQPDDVLVARHDKDVSVLPFNKPALDISNFDITGRTQEPFEVFAWSGRDLYRPGETLHASALLRDYDGKPMKAQPLYVRLKQPDGRSLIDTKLDPKDLNYFELSQAIPADAPTGLWQLEFRLDPASKESVQAFPFHVEDFLPERLKLDLSSAQPRLLPGQPLKLAVAASYLYGAPADGNRFTAKLTVQPEVHPLPNLADTFFGNPLVDVPKPDDDNTIDDKLDAQGHLSQDIELPDAIKPVAPLNINLSGSVYESGGRAVTRMLNRVYWPAPQLVGVRPLFDPKQGAESEGNAKFEILRADADGKLVAASHLKVRLQREIRDFYWLYEHGDDWKSNNNVRLQLIEEKDIDVAAGQRVQVQFPVEWGGYRLEVYDPQTQLTTEFPFFAGYSWDDENLGKEARPDKVKLALDKARYHVGDTMKVTVTPPHDGPGVLLVESDHLLYTRDIDAKAGATFEIPVTAEWERHDVYVSALVFRGGDAGDHTTPARAVGIEHVTMDRDNRRIPLTLKAPALMRPGNPLDISVQAQNLGGKHAYVTVSAVDQGVLNITNYPVPDAWAWMFAKRAFGVDAYDLYSRVIEAMDGAEAKLRYGGDMSGKLPHSPNINPKVQIVDLFSGPVAFDAQGNAQLHLPVPDFNGSLRVSAVAYTDDSFGNSSSNVTVRAPLVVEPSTPRVMAGNDKAQISIDLKNLSGKDGVAKLSVQSNGLIHIDNASRDVPLKDGAGTTVLMPLNATGGAGVATIDIHAELNDYKVDRHFEFAARPAWPEQITTTPMVLEDGKPVHLDAQPAGLIPGTVKAQVSLSTLPPLPYATALRELLRYPYGCIEQTTSKGYAALYMDAKTAKALGAEGLSDPARQAAVEGALARIASFQAANGHFSFWGGTSPIEPFMTPYVVDFMLDARDSGFAVPQDVLQKALQRLSDDLLAGGHPYFGYEQHDHLRIADEAYSGFVLARVNRAPLGTLRAIFDNDRQKLVAPLPLVHLGIALKLMGDSKRAQQAIDEAFAWNKERPWYVGDYGSDLRDLATMVALTHTYGMNKPAYDAKLIDWARNATNQVHGTDQKIPYYHFSWSYLSTQEQVAIARVAHTFDAANNTSLAASVVIGGKAEAAPDNSAIWTRVLSPAEIASGVSIRQDGKGSVFATYDVAGIPTQAPAADASLVDVRRAYFTTDGKPWTGDTLKEGDTLIVELTIDAHQNMPDALVTDLLPGGLEVENLNLSGAQQWSGLVIDGINMEQHTDAADVVHEEYRDDRYDAALHLRRGDAAHVFYLVRAVTPGTYTVPPPLVEDMYRPTIRGIGNVALKQLKVIEP